MHANWRDAAEMITLTAAAITRHRDGTAVALTYLDSRASAFAHAGMPACAQMAATIKAQYCLDDGMFAEAAEALVEARLHHPATHVNRLTSFGLQISLLEHRLAIEQGVSPPENEFANLGEEIERSGDVALRLRLQMARNHRFALLGCHDDAADSLHGALHIGARHGILATLSSELKREWTANLASFERTSLSSTEIDCLTLVRSRVDEQPITGPVGKHPLSPRELQVLDFLADGLSSKEMARNLNISIGTVKGYRRKLYEKLNIYRRSDAVTAARTLHAGGSLTAAKDSHAR